MTPHDLRHTAASLFIAAGANPWMLAEILGHTDTRMIDRIYGLLYDKDRQHLRQQISHQARTSTSARATRADGNVIRLPERRSPPNAKAKGSKSPDRER